MLSAILATQVIDTTTVGRSVMTAADAAAARAAIGLGTLATQNGTFSGTSSGTNTGDQTITLTGDVTGSGTGSFAATISANAVTFAKFVAAGSAGFVGATGAGDYSHRTPTQVTAALDAMVGDSGSGGTKGLVPAPAAGDAAASKYLKADGTWATVSGGGGNSFTTVQPAIGGTNGTAVVADSSSDTLTLDTGYGMTLSGNASTDTITLNAFGEEEPIASFMGTIWETTPGIIVTNTGSALVANRKYLIPWKCTRRRTITQVQVSVTSSAVGSSIRLGIRNRNATTGEPTTLVSDCGTVSSASTGHKTITGLSITLDPGWYYLEFVSDGAPAIRGVGSQTLQSTNMGIEATSTSTLTHISALYRAFTYAALPSDETGVSQTNHNTASSSLPLMMVR